LGQVFAALWLALSIQKVTAETTTAIKLQQLPVF